MNGLLAPVAHVPRVRVDLAGQRLWLLAAGLPEFDLPIEQVRELDKVTWFSEIWGKRPTCRAVIEHCRRILAADLSYPVI
ncbi:MAG TPA: hypothetical protein PKC26_12355, partial [Plasticicumulans sp.]|nr:hypothetical protein [Plasticicumulans sp.]